MLHTLSSFTPTALTNTCTEKITLLRQNCQRHCSVSFKLFVCLMTLLVQYALDFTTPLYLSRNVASVRTSRNIPRYVSAFASNVQCRCQWRHVCTVLQQCTGKVVRLNIRSEITYSTTVVESSTTMALVVLMERCNFVSAGTETEATGHFTLPTKGGSARILLKRASWSRS